jgi:hypothetical protein
MPRVATPTTAAAPSAPVGPSGAAGSGFASGESPARCDMNALRKTFWIVLAIAIGVALIAAGEALYRVVWPTPPSVDRRDMVRMGAHVARLPKSAFAALLVNSAVGTFAASFLAGRKVGGRFALIPGEVLGLFGVMNVLLIPHPMGFVLGLMLTYTIAALLGAWIGWRSRPQPAA